jgi:hypothetical protein
LCPWGSGSLLGTQLCPTSLSWDPGEEHRPCTLAPQAGSVHVETGGLFSDHEHLPGGYT